jgi:hypothetical protein
MLRLTPLIAVMLLMLCSTVSAQTIEPSRPVEERPFPAAAHITMDGTEYRCFAANGDDWKQVAHIVVDYRAFFAWATWADAEMAKIEILRNKTLVFEQFSKDTELALKITNDAYHQEQELRESIERQKRLIQIVFGSCIAIEAAAIVWLAMAR